MTQERRYVLLEVFPNDEDNDADSYDEALTEMQMLEMLATQLGYGVVKSEPVSPRVRELREKGLRVW